MATQEDRPYLFRAADCNLLEHGLQLRRVGLGGAATVRSRSNGITHAADFQGRRTGDGGGGEGWRIGANNNNTTGEGRCCSTRTLHLASGSSA